MSEGWSRHAWVFEAMPTDRHCVKCDELLREAEPAVRVAGPAWAHRQCLPSAPSTTRTWDAHSSAQEG